MTRQMGVTEAPSSADSELFGLPDLTRACVPVCRNNRFMNSFFFRFKSNFANYSLDPLALGKLSTELAE
jgi:hypothetical protein